LVLEDSPDQAVVAARGRRNPPCPPVPEEPPDYSVDANIATALQARISANLSTASALGGVAPVLGDAALLVWFRSEVKTGSPWDAKNLTGTTISKYDPVGQFNYDAAGGALGFGLTFLLKEAGRAQAPPENQTQKPPEWGDPGSRLNPWGGKPRYGDNPSYGGSNNMGPRENLWVKNEAV